MTGLRLDIDGWLVLAGGLLLASITTALLDEFVRARYTYFDPEYAGLSVFAGPALVAIALASWAALAVPHGEGLVPMTAALAAVAGLAISLLPSVPGAGNGIEAESMPIVATFTADVAYAAVAAALVIRRAIRPDKG